MLAPDAGSKGKKRSRDVVFIDLTEEDQDVVVGKASHVRQEEISRHTRTLSASQSPSEVIDLTSDTESEFEFDPGDYLTDEGIEELLRSWNDEQPVFAAAPPSRREVSFTFFNGTLLEPGMSVELWGGRFFRITQVVEDHQGVFLRGKHFATVESLGNQFPKWEKELCWIVRATPDGVELPEEDVPVTGVKTIRKIHLTNRRHETKGTQTQHSRAYFCRLKRLSVSDTDVVIRYLTPEEADEGFQVPSSLLRLSWRGETRPFGSVDKPRETPREVFDVETGRFLPPSIDLTDENSRQYTFGDSFCGAGGVSCGARNAGLHVKWGFDHSLAPASTFAINFPNALCELADFSQFLTMSSKDMRVDVCHSSPPCQTWSSAHTIESANDDNNSALIFSAFNLIGKIKPRIHTMEETVGLIERHKEEFNCVVRDIIELGYSIHCKVVNCCDYGVPQKRKRLILIAAGPGEQLPPFPKPTHGPPGSGLLQYATIASTISNIPSNAQGHDVQRALDRGFRHGHKAPFDPNTWAKTITCSGGEGNYHPSGKRNYTAREYACLQTFPLDYKFYTRGMVKQIGNAVPPALSQAIYRAVVKSLRETDEAELRAARAQAQAQQQAERTVISLL
ncbi:hypothetical protein VTN77DRAFT_5403 [Rasamsonia byssochlamydoides]|uniref:uncharacterized protein n=1 Tax=Rasamsonia byssochlamydoides TaxID=89139 RepID=UPI003743B41D